MIDINTNISALTAERNLSKTQTNLAQAMQRLSSGLRINSAKDDAAGLGISDRMTAQIRGLNQAARNANDGISLAQTAEGALQQTTDLLQRMRELAVQSANGTNTTADRASLNTEFTQLRDEIGRIAKSTEFNGTVLLSGGLATGVNFQVGANAGQTITVSIGAATSTALGVNANTVSTANQASTAITSIDSALKSVDTLRSNLGAVQNRLSTTIDNLSNVSENLTSARSRIQDADIAQETANMTKYNILQQAGTAILSQANQSNNIALALLKG